MVLNKLNSRSAKAAVVAAIVAGCLVVSCTTGSAVPDTVPSPVPVDPTVPVVVASTPVAPVATRLLATPTPTVTPTQVLAVTAEVARVTAVAVPKPANTPTPTVEATEAPSVAVRETAAPVPEPTDTPTVGPTEGPTSGPTLTPAPTATFTPEPSPKPTDTPVPPAPTYTPAPRPTVHPELAGLSQLLAEAVSALPAELGFAADGLSDGELEVLEWADSRLFNNESFVSSRFGPDKWEDDVKFASVQAVPLLMQAIEVQKKADGKHVIEWELDALDGILDDLGIYEGSCTSCYGKSYGEDFVAKYYRIINSPGHFHREMLKTFAYLAKLDGEGILTRSFMENDADDFELLYSSAPYESETSDSLGTSFRWGNLSFMSQVKLPDGSLKSFPTMVYEIVGTAGSQREAYGRWVDHLSEIMHHHSGNNDEFADVYRPYSQTPYAPEPGYVILVGLADRWVSTSVTVSALRALGLKAEQTTASRGRRSLGVVEIDGTSYYHEGHMPLDGNDYGMCRYLVPNPELFEIRDSFDLYLGLDEHCGGSIQALTHLGIWPPPPKNESRVDRAALTTLYNSTKGPDWHHSENWDGELTLRAWHGVAVNPESGRVTHLMLTSNGLSGELPPELGHLEELEELLLAGNPELTGCVPAALRDRLKRHTGVEFCDPAQQESMPSLVRDEHGISIDRKALAALHKATDGANWSHQGFNPAGRGEDPEPGDKNWLSELPLSEWSGVTVDETGRVVRLDLHWRALSGNIPPEIANLEKLRVLDLRSNKLVGGIPLELAKLDNLRNLGLSRNGLTGEIPPELGDLDKLELLHLDGNDLAGEIPAELGSLSELRELLLHSNELTGAMPAELGSLANLHSLRLNWNSLTGELPPELGNLGRLGELILAGNQLTGTIPLQLGDLERLTKESLQIIGSQTNPSHVSFGSEFGLSLNNNLLTGSIPPEIGNLTELKGLALTDNQLTGEIPSELGNMAGLIDLNLSGNHLTGAIPPELGKLETVRNLNLSGNELTGPIPPELAQLGEIYRLNLGHNELTGEIPPELGNLPAGPFGLIELRLNDNQLTGVIPGELGRLENLRKLHLQRNQLTGEIPPQFGGFELLGELLLNDNKLTGTIARELTTLVQKAPGSGYAIGGLNWLDLSGNRFTGEIPPGLGNLHHTLRRLALGDNELGGAIPSEIGDLIKLKRLDLTDNSLTGPIPPELGQLSELTFLDLSGNLLTGEIHPDLSNLGELQNLSLSYNMLTGGIPAWLGDLSQLALLNLSGNQLTGDIPSELGDLDMLRFLWIGGNELTGCVPASLEDKLQGPALEIPVCN